MSNKGKALMVPKLRFPDFREAEGWKEVPLSELISALDAGVSVNSGDRPATANEIGILKTSAVTNGVFEPQENKVVFDEVERGRVKESVRGGTIIISRMNTPALVGANAYVEANLENLYLPDRLWAAKSKLGTSMRFVASILGSDKGRAALSQLAKGSSGSMKNITKPDVLAFLVKSPSPAEQQKIADCLSSLDELIAAQARKVDALKTHKKGLMQQLFPLKGETQPRLRFPEFQGAWRTEAIGLVCDLYQPVTLSASELSMTGEYLVYGANGVIGTHNQYNHEHSEVAVTCRGATCGEMTTTLPQSWITGNAMVVRPKKENIRKDFLYQSLKNHGLKNVISGSAQPQITRTGFAPLAFSYPTIEEQLLIANCLNSLDAVITAANKELEEIKTYKKGLMQQLFTSAEAVEE